MLCRCTCVARVHRAGVHARCIVALVLTHMRCMHGELAWVALIHPSVHPCMHPAMHPAIHASISAFASGMTLIAHQLGGAHLIIALA
eukprot:364602-Chlamydomonas_euryale.AAC.2